MSFNVLDVGCGSRPTGTVNIDFFEGGWNSQEGDQKQGEFLNPHLIPNFVVADACHLPFRDGAFNLVYSSHTIEHVPDPFLMYFEMCRVSNHKVVIRYPHKRGSGAKRPFHINYFDESWFKERAKKLGYNNEQFIFSYDHPISSRISCPTRLKTFLLWRLLRKLERRYLIQKLKIPFEVETWINIIKTKVYCAHINYFVVYNNLDILRNCFLTSPQVNRANVFATLNLHSLPLPYLFNRFAENFEDSWLVFCHQDFVLNSDLASVLKGQDVNNIYGVIGVRTGDEQFFGEVTQTNGSQLGLYLKNPVPVQTLDEMCLIVHSSLFRKGLCFDEKFGVHFYGADLCIQAYTLGFGVYALQVNCNHKSKTLKGDVYSADYLSCKKRFTEKWRKYLPIRTTTGLIP